MSSLDSLRHSAAHMLAAAVQKMYPGVKLGIGPTIEHGFYYDFEFPKGVAISDKDLPRIEKRMKEIARQGHAFARREVTVAEAREFEKDQPYKLDLIDEFAKENQKLTLYVSGPFTDLCRGGHVTNTREIPLEGLKLHRVAGAYWRGSEKNPMLTRIYGLLFATKDELDKHLAMLAEAEKRDHRKLGEQLDLFTFSDLVGPGLPLWTPKGNIIREELEHWAKETEDKWGYVRVATPHIAKHTLFETSGHLPYYKDDMYSPMTIDGEDYYLKGMNCPHHHMIFKSSPKSYRDLPLRYAEYGMVYRYEQSGTLFGLMRVRAIDQNDAHIYCTEDQAEEEFLKVLKLHEYYYRTLGLSRDDYHLVIGLPDEKKRDKYHGEKPLWDKAEAMMRAAIKKSGIRSVDDVGGAAFYGPKIDFVIKSSIGREFAISTNQLDLYMPTRFGLEYTDKDGSKKLCAVIHRAPLGSHERFIGFLIEHYAGAFPVWLSPVQVSIIPVAERHNRPAQKLAKDLSAAGVRMHCDDANESVGYKIRKAEKQKVPYMIVLGDKELSSVSSRAKTAKGGRSRGISLLRLPIRVRGRKNLLRLTSKQFLVRITAEIAKRK